MSIIYATSPRTGKTYSVSIAGSSPTQAEDAEIRSFIDQVEGFGVAPTAASETSETGNLIDFGKGAISGFARGFADIPGGIASLAAAGLSYIPGDQGEEEIEAFGQGITDVARSGIDYVMGPLDDNVASKSGQAVGSLASFLVPFAGGAKVASLAGAGVKATRLTGSVSAGTMGVALGAQNQVDRVARVLEEGGEVDNRELSILMGGGIGATEALPVGKVFGAVANILKKVPKQAKQSAIKTITQRLKSAGVAGVAEGGQEVVAAVLQDLVEKNMYNPDLELSASAYSDDAIYGGGAGATFNFLLESIAGRRIKKVVKAREQLERDQREEGAEVVGNVARAEASMAGPAGVDTPLLPAPRLQLTDQRVPEETATEEDVQESTVGYLGAIDSVKQQVALQNRSDETQALGAAARQSQLGGLSIDLSSLPSNLAQQISNRRLRRGSDIALDAPTSLNEIKAVLPDGPEKDKILRDLELREKPDIVQSKTVEEAEAEKKVTDNLSLARVAVETGRVTNKDGTISRSKLQRELKIGTVEAQSLIDKLARQGELNPVGRNKKDEVVYQPIQPEKTLEEAVPNEAEQRVQEFESTLAELRVQQAQEQRVLEDMKRRSTATQQEQLELEAQQRRVSDLNGRVDLQQNGLRNAQAAVGPKPKQQVQLRANEARSAVSEADQAVPTDNHRRRLNTIANSLRKYLAGIGLADVDLTTTNVIDVGVETDPETGKEMPFLVEGEETKGVDGRRIITLAMEIYDPNLSDAELEQRLAGVLNHEIIHSMKALGLFTDAEYQSLVKAAESRKYTKRTGGRNIQRDYTFLDRAEFMYPDLDPEGQQEEAIAEMFRAYTDGRLKIAGRPKSLFRRMVQFIKRIFGGYNEAGFKSVDELFSDIKSGKVGRRDRVAERAYQQFGGARASRAFVLQGFTEPEKGNVARIKGAFKDVTLRVPELEKAANDLANNVIDAREYDRAVNLFKPAIPYPSVPQPATLEDLNRGLKESQIPMINQLNSSFDGLLTGLRLDIPAYTNNGVWVPTIHYGKRSKEKTEDGKSLANKVISHQSVGAVTNATFEAPYGAALNVAKGAAKGPFATIEGMYKHFSTEEAFALAERMINDPDVVQVGFDPTRHSYFYDRITMQPVIGADFVLQVGPLVLARKPRAGAKFIDEIGPAVAGDQTRKFSIVRLPNLPDNLIGPLAVVNDAKAQYMQSVGLPNRRQAEYVQVNTELARRIAVAFEESESNPDDPDVIAAYKAMADETMAQWQFVKDTGIKIEFIRNGKNPYPGGSKDVLADIRDNNHLWVFATKDGFGTSEITPQDIAQNPMLADSGELIDGLPATVNDIFRIVHDYFGHGLEGSTFTARGEENAWQAHVRMYSPLAARAMTTETRGQNSWVNFNEVSGLSNRADPANTVYADQKLVILPSFVMEEGIAPDMEIKNEGQEFRESSEELDSRRDERADNARATGTGGRAGSSRFSRKTVSGGFARKVDAEPESGFVTLTHYSPIADLETIDPEKQRTNFRMRGEEQKRASRHKEMYPARSYYGMNVGEDIGYKKEYSTGDNVYQVNVPLESLYNFDLDPDGFRGQAEPVADREVRAFSPETEVKEKAEYVATLTEKMIKDAGYSGYWTDSGIGRVAAVFNPLSVEPSDGVKSTETKQIKMSRRRLPAGYADILPFMLEDEVELTESGMRHHVESRITNLVNIFNTLPSQEEMASVAVAGKAKRGWYKNSAQAILDIFGIYDGRRFTALLAATSPQTSVESNAINTLNIWANWNNAGRPKDRASILRIMGESVQGDKGEESILGAWINNSLRALSAPEGSEMQLQLSGPKVNSFMLNLVGAVDEVTNDAWMANYALVNQAIFSGREVKGSEDVFGKIGVKGVGYIAFSANVRRAADAASQITGDQWTPAEIQETVWSLSKALTETRKSKQGNMSGLTAKEMLQQGVITDKDVADVPDFATLFSNGIYGRILENAGYEKELSNIRSLSESIGSPVEARSVYGAEDLSINPSNFRDELERFANRIETLARKTDDEVKQSRSVVRVPVNFNPPSTKSITALVDENEEAYQRLTYNNVSKILAPVARKFWDSNDNAEARLARTERFITKFQDAMLPVGKMVDELKADGFTVTEGLDPYMREERSHGIIGFKLEQNTQNLFEPLRDTIGDIDISEAKISELTGGKVPKSYFLIDAIKANGERMAIADAYMYALHAKERNEYVQNRHGRGLGSGMSETEANSIINWVNSLDLQNQQLLNGVRDYVKQIVASTNAVRRDGGLMAEEYQYENYVPLRGNLDPESEMAEDGAGLARTYTKRKPDLYGGKRNQDPRITAGRGTSYAEDIIGTVMMQNQTSIVDAERNKVGQTLLNMLDPTLANPNADASLVEAAKKLDMKGIAEVVTDVTDQIRDNVLGVKVNGQKDPVNILIFDDRIARAMKGAYGDGINRGGAVVRYLTKLNRYLSSINTTYNPEFMITNFARDLETALVNIGQYDGKGLTKEIAKNAFPAVAGIGKHIRARRGGEPYDQDNYWSQKYQEFMEDGGKNATNQIDTVKDQVNNIRDILGDISGNTMAGKFGLARTQFLGKGVRSILGMLDDANTAVENGVRVATYDALLKRGFSRARAAQAARNITVNFAKAGEERAIANALYLFYNASVQGSFALYNAMIRSPRVRKIWGGMILYGILQDQFLAAISGDEDEDGIPDYDELSDYTLEHNLMMSTLGLSDDKYIKIPLGYGINSAVNLGRALSRTQRGEYTVGQASNSIFGTLLESISPIGGVNDFDEVGDYAIVASPTVFEPATSLFVNRDFDGSPIFKEGSQFGLQKPASQRHWTTTSGISKTISRTINDLTGGSDVTPGAANVSPDIIDYIFGFYTGAAGKFVQRTAEAPLKVVDALKGDYEGDIIREIPFLRKVGVNPSAFEDVGTFIENRDKVLYAGKELQYARQRGDVEGEARIRQKFAKELSIYGQLKAMNNARNQLLRQRKEIERNPRIPDSQKGPLIKRYREKINLIVKKANALLRDAGVK